MRQTVELTVTDSLSFATVGRQFLSFAGVGAIGTAAHYATLIGTVSLGVDAVAASAIGCAIGAGVNYVLNYHLTFRSQMAHRRSLPRFALVAGSSLLFNTLLMAIEVKWLGLHYILAQVIATAIVLCSNFALSRAWAFNDSTRA